MRFTSLFLVPTTLLVTQVFAQTPANDASASDAPLNPVSVHFTKPEKFTDATYENRPSSRERVTGDIAAHLAELGRRHLPANQQLDIEITDIDLAGRYEPWQFHFHDVRFMRDVTWPRMNLKYRLADSSGKLLAEGEEKLSDMHYLGRVALRPDSDRLRYDKAMLDEWFRERFVQDSL